MVFTLAAMASLLSGCGDNPMFRNIRDVARYATSGAPETPIDRQKIANLPYATMAAKIGKGQKAVLVLAHKRFSEEEWVATDGATLVTKNGRLIKTSGFNDNIRGTQYDADDPLASESTELDGQKMYRVLDMELEGKFRSVPITSEFEVIGPRQIEIEGISFDTVLVKEHNRAHTISWKFDNYYWLDPYNGFVWKSSQHFTRNLPPVVIEVLKPAL
jgi:hypothetical protein